MNLHEHALKLVSQHRHLEAQIIEVLQKIDHVKTYQQLGYASLFTYSVQALGLSESVAYAFINVARKSREVPELKNALCKQSFSVSKANRIVSIISKDNADELIAFAQSHTQREVDKEVARRNPKRARRDRTLNLNEEQVELRATISRETDRKLQRVQSLIANKGSADIDAALSAALTEYLHRHDPVVKAERAKPAKETKLCANKDVYSRTPLTAAQKHAVFKRDKGRCTHVDAHGERCNSDRYLQIHHIIPVSCGGSNDPKNLTILCTSHHELVHQMSLPIEGQVSWLRAPTKAYVA